MESRRVFWYRNDTTPHPEHVETRYGSLEQVWYISLSFSIPQHNYHSTFQKGSTWMKKSQSTHYIKTLRKLKFGQYNKVSTAQSLTLLTPKHPLSLIQFYWSQEHAISFPCNAPSYNRANIISFIVINNNNNNSYNIIIFQSWFCVKIMQKLK